MHSDTYTACIKYLTKSVGDKTRRKMQIGKKLKLISAILQTKYKARYVHG